MGAEATHDLTAAYALDALEAAEAREYERHLVTCERCRAELAQLIAPVEALALAVAPVEPPAALRDRILEGARAERQNVVPFRRSRAVPTLSAVAAVAAVAAIGLGVWGISENRELDRARQASADLTTLLADAERTIPVSGGARGSLVVSRSGEAALVLDDLPAAPAGKRYMAWVIEGATPQPAGLFDSDDGVAQHVLPRSVGTGATVAVTVEEGPVEAPTSEPVLSATA